jgi:O-antigen/teichoic acid export membrane protein
MAAGLLVFGIAGYVFVAFTGRVLPKGEANLAITFYFLVNVVGPGIFAALEQVTSRATSRALAAELPIGTALDRARRAGATLVAAVMVILVLLTPVIVGATLHGDWALFALVLATPPIMAALHYARGQLAGRQRFGRYSGVLTVEGAVRVLLCLLLVILGVDHAWIYGVAYLAAAVAAALAAFAWLRVEPANATGAADHPPLTKSLVALALATLFSQLLPNIAPLVVTSRLAQDSAVALAFGQAAVIARIPLLMFFPIQTMLLPNLTTLVTKGELGAVAKKVRLILIGIVGLGAVGAVVFLVLGPWVLRTFLSASVDLQSSVMLLLAASTVVLIAACALQPALVALGSDRVVTTGWAVGSAVTLGFGLLPGDPVGLAAAGQVIGPGLTVLVVLLGLRAGLRRPVATPLEV